MTINKARVWFLIVTILVYSFSRSADAQHKKIQQRPASSSEQYKTDRSIYLYTYKVVNVFPHDDRAFTQGLVFDEGILYEGTGLTGSSSLRAIKIETGEVLRALKLPTRFFGEGITVFGGKIIQLTWRSNTGFIYDKMQFKLLGEFHYKTEGWGITHDGQRLIMSDGTAHLYFLDPETYAVSGRIEVADHNGPVAKLNELEYVRGEIYANIWQTDYIAIIDPATGLVKGRLDLGAVSSLAGGDNAIKTLNGIAYDKDTGRLFVTGKLWTNIYEIEIISPDGLHAPAR